MDCWFRTLRFRTIGLPFSFVSRIDRKRALARERKAAKSPARSAAVKTLVMGYVLIRLSIVCGVPVPGVVAAEPCARFEMVEGGAVVVGGEEVGAGSRWSMC